MITLQQTGYLRFVIRHKTTGRQSSETAYIQLLISNDKNASTPSIKTEEMKDKQPANDCQPLLNIGIQPIYDWHTVSHAR